MEENNKSKNWVVFAVMGAVIILMILVKLLLF